MDETGHHATLREIVQMLARLAETRAPHEHRADPKFTADEMIERDTGRRDVAAGIRRGGPDTELPPRGVGHAGEERLDGFDLDQRDFAPAMARRLRPEPGAGEIPIALKPASRERPHFDDRLHRRRRFRRDVDGDDGAFPHATILIIAKNAWKSVDARVHLSAISRRLLNEAGEHPFHFGRVR